ncbi:hypothetical protein F4775DRAFT_549983 [Biscogniauxia sp. FL1348]|nr:hypothetical protein F4775DRAFT_549983 [Biscogniauxia sp. FL1348]
MWLHHPFFFLLELVLKGEGESPRERPFLDKENQGGQRKRSTDRDRYDSTMQVIVTFCTMYVHIYTHNLPTYLHLHTLARTYDGLYLPTYGLLLPLPALAVD